MRRAMLLVGCLAVSLLGGTGPASAKAPVGPDVSVVRGGCTGGPGRAELTVSRPDADGMVRVRAVASHLPDGFRWRMTLSAGHLDDSVEEMDYRDFRRTSSGGGWTVRAAFDVSSAADSGSLAYSLFSFEPGHGSPFNRACLADVVTGRLLFGGTWCTRRVVQAVAVRRDGDGGLVARYLQTARSESTWRLEIRAVGDEADSAVTLDERASRRGLVSTRVQFSGVGDPRLAVAATNDRGRRCTMAFNPLDLRAAPLPSAAQLMAVVGETPRATTRRRSSVR